MNAMNNINRCKNNHASTIHRGLIRVFFVPEDYSPLAPTLKGVIAFFFVPHFTGGSENGFSNFPL